MGKPRGLACVPRERRLEIAAYAHQRRAQKYKETFEERFWNKLDRSGGENSCWPWTGCFKENGYGTLTEDGKARYTHRRAWELANKKEIPQGLHVCHKCDNRACCNPAHLFIGTAMDNIHDCIAKGRQMPTEQRSEIMKKVAQRGEKHWASRMPERVPRGAKSNFAKLTEELVAEIFRRRSAGELQKHIAASVGVSSCQVGRILRGVSWSHFQPEMANG